MKRTLQEYLEARAQSYVSRNRESSTILPEMDRELIQRKKQLFQRRKAEIVKCHATGQIHQRDDVDGQTHIKYGVHYQYLVRQNKNLYLEEQCEERMAIFESKQLVEDKVVESEVDQEYEPMDRSLTPENSRAFIYDRLNAVRYAERWWNSYNPEYEKFQDNCTNFISQCLHAGNAPMRGYPNRGSGWWMMNNNWSYSWSVANALRWYLSSSEQGLRAKEMSSPRELLLGDLICYDFEGDGRFNHNTIVTAKDAFGYPLVNAQTQNSRMRYWSYEDSTAYTPNIKYKFFHIVDDS